MGGGLGPERGDAFALLPYLRDGYTEALEAAFPLLRGTLRVRRDIEGMRYLFATAAALKGFRRFGELLSNLDAMYGTCPKCGEVVYPDGVRAALEPGDT